LSVDNKDSLESIIRQHIKDPVVGASIVLNGIRLSVHEMVGSRIATIGVLPAKAEAQLDG
jgi:potassium/hydrogen antiporter